MMTRSSEKKARENASEELPGADLRKNAAKLVQPVPKKAEWGRPAQPPPPRKVVVVSAPTAPLLIKARVRAKVDTKEPVTSFSKVQEAKTEVVQL